MRWRAHAMDCVSLPGIIPLGLKAHPAFGQSARSFSFDEWKEKRGQDEHSVVADPRFTDAEHGDFSMRPDSPVGPRNNANPRR